MAHLVLGETLLADRLEFTVPGPVMSTRAFPSLEEEAKAACAYMGLQLVDYEVFQAMWIANQRRFILFGRRGAYSLRDDRG